jgi:YrbI family 3-deoxy-D-manno-octulosonate 8-phosphate phosphatase
MSNKLLDRAKKIKLIATDIDGVWTDSKMYYTEQGLLMKSFSTYDGLGSWLLLKNNFIIAMITSEYEHLDILHTRAKKLNIKEIYTNEHNKLKRLKYLTKKYNLTKDNVAYIGDDLNDLDALKFSGLSASPLNSPILEHYKPHFITTRKGGDGAFRELAELILKAQNIKPTY